MTRTETIVLTGPQIILLKKKKKHRLDYEQEYTQKI